MKQGAKDIKDLLRELHSDWTVTYTGSGHYKLTHRNGVFLFLSSTPGGNKKWLRNSKAKIKRALRNAK